jgi:spore germination protein
MINHLPEFTEKLLSRMEFIATHLNLRNKMTHRELLWSFGTVSLSLLCLLFIFVSGNGKAIGQIISPIIATLSPLHPLGEGKKGNEVFGFAPYWTINKLDNVDFNTLTTFAYFGVEIGEDGNLVKDDRGYEVFHSEKATEIFKKAHDHGTRVVLTLTLMDNASIKTFLADPEARERTIAQATEEVKKRGIDGVNIDIEYSGNPGSAARDNFSIFVKDMTTALHNEIPESRVTVSVYASSAKGQKLYDIASIGKSSDAIFMMAYDFATSGSDQVIPTSPLYGHKEGKYWYDVSTAVEDFLKVMPGDKLILGLPWYGYNYPVSKPGVKVAKYEGYSYYYWQNRRRYLAHFRPSANAQTYAAANKDVTPEMTGWDDVGKVGWRAYKTDGIWRMIFLDDEKSLALKYQFAKDKNLAGVGMWALGFDDGRDELWSLLKKEFGEKLADNRIMSREIQEEL